METSKENMQKAYCRLCAECQSIKDLIDLRFDEIKYKEITYILSCLQVNYVDFSSIDLPTVVCTICYSFLIKIHQFLSNVKNAQNVLTVLSSSKVALPHDAYLEVPKLQDTLEYPGVKVFGSASAFNVDVKIESNSYTENLQQFTDQDRLTSHDQNVSENTKIFADNLPITPEKVKIETKIEKSPSDTKSTISKTTKLEKAKAKMSKTKIKKEKRSRKMKEPKLKIVKIKSEETKLNKTESDSRIAKQRCKRKKDSADPLQAYSWTCMQCYSKFETTDLLMAHQKEVHGIMPFRKRITKNVPLTSADLTCDTCKETFATLKNLQTHTWKVHNPNKLKHLVCDKCGKLYQTEQSFRNHVNQHEGIKPHVCQICDKSFVNVKNLRNHVKWHLNIKQFVCNECGRQFITKWRLQSHLIVHTDFKPYSCQYCTKTFRFKVNLSNHERVHTGDYSFECKPCGMKFSCWSNCNKHMKRIHKTTMKQAQEEQKDQMPEYPEYPMGQAPITVGGEDKKPVDLEEWKRTVMIKFKPGKKPVKGTAK